MAGAVAGDIVVAADPPNANWRRCDGSYILNVNFNDYWRRVRFQHGGGWIGGMRLPLIPGSIICVQDDPDYAPPAPPTNVDVPHVSQAGATLNCTMGNWTGEPTGYAYRWQINGVDEGTNAADYAVQPEDVGLTATCTVTASNAAGATQAPVSNAVVIADPAAAMRA